MADLAIFEFFTAVFFLTYKLNKHIEHEVQKIVSVLKSLVKKQKSTYIQSDFSQEFFQITSLLSKVAQIIAKKEKRKSKYTEQLKQLNQQKDDIISAISHEFKNPIAVVNGYSQTLIEDTDINPNIRQKFLSKIHSNGIKLSELIDTLRLSLKLDSHQKSLSLKATNIYALTQECAEALKLNYPYRSILLEGEKSLNVDVDPTMFGIVLTNLIENALKYSEDEVLVRITQKSIEVVDTGIGISEKNISKITKKFYRVQTNSWNNSLGLGLFLVDNILKLHNFKLEITSKPNTGSSFKVLFS